MQMSLSTMFATLTLLLGSSRVANGFSYFGLVFRSNHPLSPQSMEGLPKVVQTKASQQIRQDVQSLSSRWLSVWVQGG